MAQRLQHQVHLSQREKEVRHSRPRDSRGGIATATGDTRCDEAFRTALDSMLITLAVPCGHSAWCWCRRSWKDSLRSRMYVGSDRLL